MCNKVDLSKIQTEGYSIKRQKKSNQTNKIEYADDLVVLPSVVKSWILHIGVNLEAYQQSLYQVSKSLKKRYYRFPGSIKISLNEDSTGKHLSHYEKESEEDVNGSHKVVRWIRDLELYECYNSIPKTAIGLDAASAAVVDSLRLYELYKDDGSKWILDMCCAPGGKLLGIVSCVRNMCRKGLKWRVFGMDTVKRRLDICASFLKREDVPEDIEISLINSRGQDFRVNKGDSMLERFDRILVDAECTYEGSLRSVIRTLKYWGSDSLECRFTPEYAESIIKNQRELLMHAIHLLKPGGLVIYSTCSLHKEQNELLVSEVIKQFDNVKFQQLPMLFCKCCTRNSNRTDKWPATSAETLLREHCPIQYFPNRKNNECTGCNNLESPVSVRFSPLAPETDGIFIAGIRKLDESFTTIA
ncbi:hypothetical protein BgAZ_404170 [Babesia gibsoni]|uniref:SAM-dependent MTase RsmB/NOP-type domain-containing protein n=1 Tax=Babesia gibsoni TaxID=33632 RepID=A0AAD8LIU9_BABGI|nr:hypothetical protein BgAZ_404170 [Babesia gibsoni]